MVRDQIFWRYRILFAFIRGSELMLIDASKVVVALICTQFALTE